MKMKTILSISIALLALFAVSMMATSSEHEQTAYFGCQSCDTTDIQGENATMDHRHQPAGKAGKNCWTFAGWKYCR
jgi:hypothetical protein